MSPITSRFKMRANVHGIIGLTAIASMVGVAFYLRWNVIWWYFVLSILTYSLSIISFTVSTENTNNSTNLIFRWLLGCHIAFLFLAGGLWLNFPNIFVQGAIFITSIGIGLVIPFILFTATIYTRYAEYRTPIIMFNKYGLLGLIPAALMIGVAFYLRWDVIWWYFILSILIYSISVILLTISMEEARNAPNYHHSLGTFQSFRLLLCCHIAFLLLAGGLWLNFPNFFVQVGIFLASVAVGLVIPFLLFR